ncbi:hypothetical protein C7T35_39770 [Variovorax sp. WS11]|uniref:hypothetical protein n=1 Tax=Variovorax sp. WS11 TaxID=1105204 RepID=UPI000D0CEA1B|nr:hypothetical protein [Variovorax sp. WS11]NDZ16987.1 hypothetical protein [Variovorax sp. WS11]PSL79029.1 hypothetical protein C7T35_39770 [Variovorax sp. WS11]
MCEAVNESPPDQDESWLQDKRKADYGAELARGAAQNAADTAAREKSLERLYDYTKFHIQAYLTLATVYVGVANLKAGKDQLLIPMSPWFVLLAVIAFAVAGFAGGVIVSSITQYIGPPNRSSETFLAERIGPMWKRGWPALKWTYLEHGAFWAGLALAALSIISGRVCSYESSTCPYFGLPVPQADSPAENRTGATPPSVTVNQLGGMTHRLRQR